MFRRELGALFVIGGQAVKPPGVLYLFLLLLLVAKPRSGAATSSVSTFLVAKPRSGATTSSVSTFSYYWWPSREAAKPPQVFLPFRIIIITHLLPPLDVYGSP